MIGISGGPGSFIGMVNKVKEEQLKSALDRLCGDVTYEAATTIYRYGVDQTDRDAVKAEVINQLENIKPTLLFHFDEEQEKNLIEKAVDIIYGDTPIQQVIDFLGG